MAFYNKFIKNSISLAINSSYIPHKFIGPPITTSTNNFSKLTFIRRKLGILEPPKKPVNAFMKYVQMTRAEINEPNKSQREVVALASERWKNLSESEKQVYYKGYSEALTLYKKSLEQYKSTLDEKQIESLEKERNRSESERALKIEKRNRIKMLHELGKPKQPVSGYLLFKAEENKNGDKMIASISAKWSSLSWNEREKYNDKVREARQEYKKRLFKWEAKMVALGFGHLVRANRLKPMKKNENYERRIK